MYSSPRMSTSIWISYHHYHHHHHATLLWTIVDLVALFVAVVWMCVNISNYDAELWKTFYCCNTPTIIIPGDVMLGKPISSKQLPPRPVYLLCFLKVKSTVGDITISPKLYPPIIIDSQKKNPTSTSKQPISELCVLGDNSLMPMQTNFIMSKVQNFIFGQGFLKCAISPVIHICLLDQISM